MFAGLGSGRNVNLKASKAQVEVEMAAHGGAVVEIAREGGTWKVVPDSKYARRITANTPIEVSGPAAGHDMLKTSADPTGRKVFGTLNNCAGGTTPWGTLLTCEENFHGYFGGDAERRPMPRPTSATACEGHAGTPGPSTRPLQPREGAERAVPLRLGGRDRSLRSRLDAGQAHRARPLQARGLHLRVAKDGRVVVYSRRRRALRVRLQVRHRAAVEPHDRAANMDLLDDGTLYVARFNDDGKVEWLPLVHGQGPLTAENGFTSQADVVIYARRAADLLEGDADGPAGGHRDQPGNGRVYVVLTNNTQRTEQQVNAPNPRRATPTATSSRSRPRTATTPRPKAPGRSSCSAAGPAGSGRALSSRGVGEWLAVLRRQLRLRPQGPHLDRHRRRADGGRHRRRHLCRRHRGRRPRPDALLLPGADRRRGVRADLTPDDSTLFLAMQHPGEDAGSTFEKPSTRWPDFKDGMPPRPSVIAITKKGGGAIGSDLPGRAPPGVS